MTRVFGVALVALVLFLPVSARGGDPAADKAAGDAALSALDAAVARLTELAAGLVRDKRDAEAARVVEMISKLLELRRSLGDLLPAAAPLPAAPPPAAPPAEMSPPPSEPGWTVPAAFAGRFEKRDPRKGWATAKTEAAVALALDWLAAHQDEGGRWDGGGFMKHDKVPPVCDGANFGDHDPGVTGLALLAFLGAGETHRAGPHAGTVRRGLAFLAGLADEDGCIGPRTSTKFVYDHAIAALALVEDYALTGSPFLKDAAQRAVDFVGKCQNPYLAWRYGVRPGENDTSVSGWMLWVLWAARTAGLVVDASAGFDGMKAWLEKVTEPEYGRVGYTGRGTSPARPDDLTDRFPADKSESLTAIGIWSRVLLGEVPKKSEPIRKGVDLLLRCLPVWDEASGGIDLYYWLFGTQALFQVGGDPFKEWNEWLRVALVDHQRKDPVSFKGSWDPLDPWGRDGGRVYSTAVCALALETAWRYAPLVVRKPWEK